MAYDAIVESRDGSPIAQFGLHGLDFEYAQSLADLGAYLSTPLAKQFNLLDCYYENSQSPNFTMFLNEIVQPIDSALDATESDDSIEIYHATELDGRKIFVGQLATYVAVEGSIDLGAVEKLVLTLGSSMTELREPNLEHALGSYPSKKAESKYACTVIEEATSSGNLAIVRFNLANPNPHSNSWPSEILDDPNFVQDTLRATGHL